jgi:hypothetical protein
MYGNANQGMDDIFSFQFIFSFFNKSILGDIFQFNQHFLILNRYGSHITLEKIA